MPETLQFQRLFEQSPDVLLVLLPDAPRFTMVGATQTRLDVTHTTREQTIGRGLFEVFPDNPDDPAATGTSNLRASLERVVATKAPDTMAVQKYDIRGPDGSFQARYWSPRNLPVLSDSGELLYILHRVEDVTELMRTNQRGEELLGRNRAMELDIIARSQELAAANQQLREANTQLGELDSAKTAFFSNVSHEFRTPLTLMFGPLEDALAAADEPLGLRQRARIELVRDNAHRLFKLVNALLDFSRLEAGRMQARYAPLDLAALTAELAGMFHSAMETAGLRFVIDCPRLSEAIFVDRDMWEKIVPNLVSNAFKFTLAGEIAVRVREAPSHVTVEVADTGTGIPEAELPRIFERFRRVEGTTGRTHEGSGIGLSLVRELVQLHGGTIHVESVLGRGSTFRIEIPKGSAHLPAEAVSQVPVEKGVSRDARTYVTEARRLAGQDRTAPAADPLVRQGSGERARVLVVDDNADLRRYISDLLIPYYDVVTAPDGQAAVESVREQVPDLVVTDVMMPRLDGFGLLRSLRSDRRTATVPVILLSARAGEEASVEGLDAGADDYLVKPFTARELQARVRTHVELARVRRASMEQLEQANRELEAFSYTTSHDLKTPLNAIRGFSELLLDRSAELDPVSRRQLSRILGASEHMRRTIDGLLSLARAGQAAVVREEVDLSALAAGVTERLAAAHEGRAVTVEIQPRMVVQADPPLLEVVLANLLGNAWKFTRSSPDARISVTAAFDSNPTVFCVSDNGVGFDPAMVHHLFRAFQRLHSAAEFEGSGIGLATVQRIVTRHGGSIRAESSVGGGARFYFTLAPAEAPQDSGEGRGQRGALGTDALMKH